MDIKSFYRDYSIPYASAGEHSHVTSGWIGTHCPFCNGKSFHLGFNLESNYFFCWRCGWHPLYETISRLTNIETRTKIDAIIKTYRLSQNEKVESIQVERKTSRPSILTLPSGLGPMHNGHRNYLIKRGFDPDHLEKIWKLSGTGPYSKIADKIDYRHRIVFPYIWNNKQVSFDSRDITGRAKAKYKACPLELEIIPHKHILYGLQQFWGISGICVEGPTDVWRLGPKAFGVSGIQFTSFQIREMARTFKKIFILFDNDIQAKKQAEKLRIELRFRGVKTEIIYIEDFNVSDPGSLNQDDANYLVKELIYKP